MEEVRVKKMLKHVLVLALLIAVAAVAARIALGTPPSGISATTLVRGLAVDKVKTQGNQPYDVVVQDITVAPGGTFGWHTHPGNALGIVKSGTLTIYDSDDRSCSPKTFEAGDVYVDPGFGHVHIGRNEGATPLEIIGVFLDVPIGGSVRIDAPDPGNCPF